MFKSITIPPEDVNSVCPEMVDSGSGQSTGHTNKHKLYVLNIRRKRGITALNREHPLTANH